MHIAIAGNIGSGKTTLTTKLAKHYKWEAHYEDVENNPYLNDYPASSGIGRGKGNPTGIPTTEILWDFLNQHSKIIDNDS